MAYGTAYGPAAVRSLGRAGPVWGHRAAGHGGVVSGGVPSDGGRPDEGRSAGKGR
ncbi:hypothetical protein SUDANB58_05240 [Streptomyces sp. enrichment culture]